MADLAKLLEKTSRTFALSIPVLPEPTHREVMIAYLLFRIADTFEDAAHWEPEKRIQALSDFRLLLGNPSRPEAERLARQWSAANPAEHAGYRELIAEVPDVLDAFFALPPGAVESVRHHVSRSAEGMAAYVARTRGGQLVVKDVPDLKAYCYQVAGIVGEMLTELFLLDRQQLAPIAGFLRERAATFGEALQLVNILKDASVDTSEGRSYLPAGIPRAEIFALARHDLSVAGDYIAALQEHGAPRGIVEFCALPVLLARASLDKIESHGPGSKISRPEVFLLAQRLRKALDHGRPAV